MELNVVFMGTPAFAVPSLQALLDDPHITVRGVMTQPDRPSGRGQKLMPPPVKVLAESHGIAVSQPTRLRKDPYAMDWLRSLAPDYLVTAAFGQILPQEVLDIPRYGTVNVHASLLPRYRGANPIQWAILNGETIAGITTMFTVLEVDAGPMLLQASTPIGPDEDAATLTDRLSHLGAGILPETLHGFAAGTLKAREQDTTLSTHAPKLAKEDAVLDWSLAAEQVHNRIRAQQPWPGATTVLGEDVLKLYDSAVPDEESAPPDTVPGTILKIGPQGLLIATGSRPVLIRTVQPPGKPRMSARDWANGALKGDALPRLG